MFSNIFAFYYALAARKRHKSLPFSEPLTLIAIGLLIFLPFAAIEFLMFIFPMQMIKEFQLIFGVVSMLLVMLGLRESYSLKEGDCD